MSVRWSLTVFDVKTERLAVEIPLTEEQARAIAAACGHPDHDGIGDLPVEAFLEMWAEP